MIVEINFPYCFDVPFEFERKMAWKFWSTKAERNRSVTGQFWLASQSRRVHPMPERHRPETERVLTIDRLTVSSLNCSLAIGRWLSMEFKSSDKGHRSLRCTMESLISRTVAAPAIFSEFYRRWTIIQLLSSFGVSFEIVIYRRFGD